MAKTLALSHSFYTQLNGLLKIHNWSVNKIPLYFEKKRKRKIKIKTKIKIQFNLLIKNQKLFVTTLIIIILFEIKIGTIYYHHQKIAKE